MASVNRVGRPATHYLLKRILHAPLLPQTCGINKEDLFTINHGGYIDRITSRARKRGDHSPIGSHPCVHQGGLSCIRSADNGNAGALIFFPISLRPPLSDFRHE